jgi:hypothetical protein
VEVYTLRGKTTYVGSPVEEIRCNLAIQAFAYASIQFHQIEWVGSDRLRLHVRLRDAAGKSHDDQVYLVDAHTGQILETSSPINRNWTCASLWPPASGDLVVRRVDTR